MNKFWCLIFILCCAITHAKKSKPEEKPSWAKKDIQDFSDADMERFVQGKSLILALRFLISQSGTKALKDCYRIFKGKYI